MLQIPQKTKKDTNFSRIFFRHPLTLATELLFLLPFRRKLVKSAGSKLKNFKIHLFGEKYGASILCPAVLCHIFTVKLRPSCLKITDVIALNETRINTVTRGFMA